MHNLIINILKLFCIYIYTFIQKCVLTSITKQRCVTNGIVQCDKSDNTRKRCTYGNRHRSAAVGCCQDDAGGGCGVGCEGDGGSRKYCCRCNIGRGHVRNIKAIYSGLLTARRIHRSGTTGTHKSLLAICHDARTLLLLSSSRRRILQHASFLYKEMRVGT